MNKNSPPNTEKELLSRCQNLAGKTIAQVAEELSIAVPENLQRHKGWVGQLIEHYLGADAGNQAEPDFSGLGIELKTLPLNKLGKAKESTYVCTVSLSDSNYLQWNDSWVKRKLSKVLWVPIEADKDILLADRYIGQAWLWQPNQQQQNQLQQDWQELMERIVVGEQAELSAREGQYLQIRPKAANSRVTAQYVDDKGASVLVNPRGFYLRTDFTNQLLADSYE